MVLFDPEEMHCPSAGLPQGSHPRKPSDCRRSVLPASSPLSPAMGDTSCVTLLQRPKCSAQGSQLRHAPARGDRIGARRLVAGLPSGPAAHHAAGEQHERHHSPPTPAMSFNHLVTTNRPRVHQHNHRVVPVAVHNRCHRLCGQHLRTASAAECCCSLRCYATSLATQQQCVRRCHRCVGGTA